MNKIILIGYVGNDPITKDNVATFSLATKEGTRTEWHRIVVFKPVLIDMTKKYVRKGRKLAIEGSIHTREYINATGEKKNITEVVLSDLHGYMEFLNGYERREDVKEAVNDDDSLDEIPY